MPVSLHEAHLKGTSWKCLQRRFFQSRFGTLPQQLKHAHQSYHPEGSPLTCTSDNVAVSIADCGRYMTGHNAYLLTAELKCSERSQLQSAPRRNTEYPHLRQALVLIGQQVQVPTLVASKEICRFQLKEQCREAAARV